MFILIGNKLDLLDKWEIKESDAKKFNGELNVPNQRINLNPINRRRPRTRMFCI